LLDAPWNPTQLRRMTRGSPIRFQLPLRNVEDLLQERGIEIRHQTVRLWWNRFGPLFASEIRERRVGGMRSSRWQLD
jgi:putative transposase